ncbi:hypothetical protein RKD37_007793 [Streptomyces ambofaciens]
MTPSMTCQGLQAHQLAALVTAGGVQQPPVDQLGDGDADDDRGLLEGAEPAAVGGRGHLGDVGGADHRGHADGETADDTPHRQVPQREGQRGADGTHGEQDRRDLHAPDPADAVGDTARGRGTDGTADQRDRDDLRQHRGTDVIAVPDRLDRTVDHGTVVTEQETAHRGRRRDEDDVPEMIGMSRPGS